MDALELSLGLRLRLGEKDQPDLWRAQRGRRSEPTLRAFARAIVAATAATLATPLVALGLATPSSATERQSLYTALTGCRKLKEVYVNERRIESGPNDSIEQCRGVGGYLVYVLATDPRSWLALAKDGAIYSLERAMIAEFDRGHFPFVQGDKIEWRLGKGVPYALIVRVGFQKQDATVDAINAGKANGSTLMVYDVRQTPPVFLGHALDNGDARGLADSVAP